jgi:hypothetical protein
MARALGIIRGASLASMCLLSALFGQSAQHLSESASVLVERFNSTTVFWEQFEVAKKIVALYDKSVLQDLQPLAQQRRYAPEGQCGVHLRKSRR